jgi:hypothetical protein
MTVSGGHTASPGSMRRIADLLRRLWDSVAGVIRGQVVQRAGGPARARVIVLFAAVLALSGADAGTVGAVAPQLESSFHINNTDLGLLSSVSLLVGAVFTIRSGCWSTAQSVRRCWRSGSLCGASRRSSAPSPQTFGTCC